MQSQPVVSVVVTSDLAVGQAREWDYLRRCLESLARQRFRERAEFILVTYAGPGRGVPDDLLRILPDLRVVESERTSSFAAKNAGTRAASAELVAFLDADCFPRPDWLERIVTVMGESPQFAGVSGKTLYEEKGLLARSLALLGRSYLDAGCRAPIRTLSNHNCALRRRILREIPFPEDVGPFGGKVHAVQLERAGQRLLFDPEPLVFHVYDGWPLESDIRRNLGYALIRQRRLHPELPFPWLGRIGWLSVPLVFTVRLLISTWIALSRHRRYRVEWYELPFVLGLVPVVHALEVPGMVQAVRGDELDDTDYV